MATTYDELYGGKYLKAADLDEDEDTIVTIKEYDLKPVGQDQEMRCVLTFKEFPEKPLVLNKTNASTLADLFGKEWDDWVGKRIILFVTPVTFAGKTSLGLRISPKLPKPKVKKTEAEINAELGYEPEQELPY